MDRLRELAERPIADSERPLLFSLAAAILVAVAIVLIALGRSASEEGAASAPPAAAPSPPPHTAPPAPAPARVPPEAKRSAGRFLAGYLRFIYGRGRAGQIEAAAPPLRQRLARSRLRVPPAARQRRPRVVELEARRLPSGAIAVAAEVADGGVARYPVHLELHRAGEGWTVVEAGGD
jgi:hypothetical protein